LLKSPCKNGATCHTIFPRSNSFSCICARGFTGQYCEKVKKRIQNKNITEYFFSINNISFPANNNETYNIEFNDGKYRMHIFPYEYDEKLPFYYNNNQRFLQKRLEPELIKKSKIFEKAEIKWVCVDDLPKMRKEFRFYFKVVVDDIIKQKNEIFNFIKKAMREKTPKNITRKNRR
jgi:hypothetical protein